METLGLSGIESTTNDLKEHTGLNLRMNPFGERLKEELLYNISTGEAAPQDVALFLTSIESTGNEMRTSMINACIENEDAFQNYTIKRVKIKNFASIIKKRKIGIGGILAEVKLQKDLFGRLLAISLEKKIDLAKVFILIESKIKKK